MTAIVPSFLAKVSRAKEHLVNLEAEVRRYADTNPYTVREGIEGKRKVHRLVYTSDPANTDIPILTADVVYNLRSSLDHLMSALVTAKDRNKAIFPIYFQGVWDDIQGENAQRLKERARWASDTKSVRKDAIAILKALQPPDDTGDSDEADLIQFVNRLSNRDRHEKLPVLIGGLKEPMAYWTRRDGTRGRGIGIPALATGFFKHDARLQIPEDAMNVQMEGTTLIAVRVGRDKRGRDRHLEIPHHLERAAAFIDQELMPRLMRFVRV